MALNIETKRINAMQALTGIANDDSIIVELAGGGTKRMTYATLLQILTDAIVGGDSQVLTADDIVNIMINNDKLIPSAKLLYDLNQVNAVMRREMDCLNGIREKGNLIDIDTLMGYVRAGEHHKYAIGDYFEDNGVQWAVAARNWYPASAFINDSRPEHIVCMPVDFLATSYKFNTSNTNAGGYAASLMPANMETEFGKLGSKVKAYCKRTQIYENNKGGWAATMRSMRLPTIVEVTGNQGWANEGFSNGVCSQLPLCRNSLFRLRSTWYWCLDPSSSDTTTFCSVQTGADSAGSSAAVPGRVRPLIVLA